MTSHQGRRILRKLGKFPKWRNWPVNENATERAKVAPGANWGGAGHRQTAIPSLRSRTGLREGNSEPQGTARVQGMAPASHLQATAHSLPWEASIYRRFNQERRMGLMESDQGVGLSAPPAGSPAALW